VRDRGHGSGPSVLPRVDLLGREPACRSSRRRSGSRRRWDPTVPRSSDPRVIGRPSPAGLLPPSADRLGGGAVPARSSASLSPGRGSLRPAGHLVVSPPPGRPHVSTPPSRPFAGEIHSRGHLHTVTGCPRPGPDRPSPGSRLEKPRSAVHRSRTPAALQLFDLRVVGVSVSPLSPADPGPSPLRRRSGLGSPPAEGHGRSSGTVEWNPPVELFSGTGGCRRRDPPSVWSEGLRRSRTSTPDPAGLPVHWETHGVPNPLDATSGARQIGPVLPITYVPIKATDVRSPRRRK